jgi:hypothetical protein
LSPVGDVASAVENALAAYSDTTVAPHEYFDHTPSEHLLDQQKKASSEESVGDWYGQMAPGSSARVPAKPLPDSGASVFFAASCLSNQFAFAGKRFAVTQGDMA